MLELNARTFAVNVDREMEFKLRAQRSELRASEVNVDREMEFRLGLIHT